MGKLMYFPAYGRAECTRMLLNHAGVQFEDVHVPYSEWLQRKPEMPYGQLPVWVDDEGNMLSQSISILHALARKHGYAPKDFHGDWANAWVSDTINDFMAKNHHQNVTRKPECSDEALKAWVADSTTFNQTIEKHLETT